MESAASDDLTSERRRSKVNLPGKTKASPHGWPQSSDTTIYFGAEFAAIFSDMKSYEVIRQAVDGPGVKSVAAGMKVSAALVYKWCEPAADASDPDQSGTKNPLDRLAELYQQTNDMRLIRWACNQASGFYVENPKAIVGTIDQNVYRQTRSMFRDFSELLDSVTESLDDDHQIDAKEADEIRQKWEDLKSLVEGFVVGCEKGHYHVKHK